MPEVTTKVEGLRELKANLEKLGAETARAVMTEGLEAGGKVLMTAIAGRTKIQTGELMSHLMMTTEVAPSGTAGQVKVGFGEQGYVARFLEFGHRIVGHKPDLKDTGKHVPAKPFMRPAFDASKTEARNAVIEVIRAKVQSK